MHCLPIDSQGNVISVSLLAIFSHTPNFRLVIQTLGLVIEHTYLHQIINPELTRRFTVFVMVTIRCSVCIAGPPVQRKIVWRVGERTFIQSQMLRWNNTERITLEILLQLTLPRLQECGHIIHETFSMKCRALRSYARNLRNAVHALALVKVNLGFNNVIDKESAFLPWTVFSARAFGAIIRCSVCIAGPPVQRKIVWRVGERTFIQSQMLRWNNTERITLEILLQLTLPRLQECGHIIHETFSMKCRALRSYARNLRNAVHALALVKVNLGFNNVIDIEPFTG